MVPAEAGGLCNVLGQQFNLASAKVCGKGSFDCEWGPRNAEGWSKGDGITWKDENSQS